MAAVLDLLAGIQPAAVWDGLPSGLSGVVHLLPAEARLSGTSSIHVESWTEWHQQHSCGELD